jgi:hypothetical protein
MKQYKIQNQSQKNSHSFVPLNMRLQEVLDKIVIHLYILTLIKNKIKCSSYTV